MVSLNNYEAMFLLDNRFATRDWSDCESDISAMFSKHGGEMIRARRWGERKLCFEIKGNKRATYALIYFQLPPANISGLLRDLELSDHVIRNLIQYREPEKMQSLLQAEDAEVQRIAEAEAQAQAQAATAQANAEQAAANAKAARNAAPAAEAASADAAPAPSAEAASADAAPAPVAEAASADAAPAAEAASADAAPETEAKEG